MTSDKKLKNHIRARMKRTGESYTTARRAIISSPFREIVQQVIVCASKALEENDARLKEKADNLGLVSFSDFADLAAEFPRPSFEQKLEALLLSLSTDEQYKLRTLMYFGRDHEEETEDGIRSLHKYLKGTDNPRHGPVEKMMEKAPLSEYLTRGLRKCDSAKIDIEKGFNVG